MLKIRHLRLRVLTDGPVCGADIVFSDGLNVLRADNSSGKSTCLQAIIYGLGLEGMLSARREIPLPHAMTDAVEIDGVELRVVSSWVVIEIENSNGEILTIRRYVKSSEKNSSLVEMFPGPLLTQGMRMEGGRDFFVRRPGAAQRESGFHFQLAKFLGWSLPQVARMDGSEGPLYLECLFPFFFVEQKHGWSGVQARIPTYFMIRDVGRRAAEFILSLDEYDAVLKRQRLESAATIMEGEWKELTRSLEALASTTEVIIRGLPLKPTIDAEQIEVQALISRSGSWAHITQEIANLYDRLEQLNQSDVPSVGESAPELERQLVGAQDELVVLNAVISQIMEEVKDSADRRDSLELRISSLIDDLQRHRDAAVLRSLGARHAAVISEGSHCPTCQQNLPDGFEVTDHPMTPDESVGYIEQELRTFRAMREDQRRIVEVKRAKLDRSRSESTELRRRIRAIRDSLTSPDAMPSVAVVAERLQISERIEILRRVEAEIFHTASELKTRASLWAANRQSLQTLAERSKSSLDMEKMAFLESALVGQLQKYRFISVSPSSIEISRDTYRPVHEGFDLGFDLSASDMIRVIWAYLIAFLEVSIRHNTNHPRLLIFDEPRQQETNRLSFAALLARASINGSAGSQIIFATSEEESTLVDMLRDLPHVLMSTPPHTKLIRVVA